MDIFLEKIVKRKKTMKDSLLIIGIILLALILMVVLLNIPLLSTFAPVILVAVGYLAYMMIRGRSIEFEYIVTNGDLDIDMIIAQRKRKRVFSGHCKDFEIVAKMASEKYDHNVQSIKKRVSAVTSMESPDVYFITTVKDGEKVLIFFEPHPKMIDSFKKFIPRKIFE